MSEGRRWQRGTGGGEGRDSDLAPKPRACAGGRGRVVKGRDHAVKGRGLMRRHPWRAFPFPAGSRLPLPPFLPRALLPGPGSPMDAFVVKLPRGQAGDGGSAGGKRPRLEGPGPERPPPREIRAEGLSCDYRILFSKAEADEIFQELEKEVEYFEGIFLPWEGARAVQGGSGGLPKGLDSALGHPAWAGGWPG